MTSAAPTAGLYTLPGAINGREPLPAAPRSLLLMTDDDDDEVHRHASNETIRVLVSATPVLSTVPIKTNNGLASVNRRA